MFKIQSTLQVTTDDLEVYVGEEPLRFEAIANIPNGLNTELLEWSKVGYPANQAVKLVPKLFLSVSQNGTSYPLSTQKEVEAFRAEVGDELTAEIVEGYWEYRFRYFKKKRIGLDTSSPMPLSTDVNEPTP